MVLSLGCSVLVPSVRYGDIDDDDDAFFVGSAPPQIAFTWRLALMAVVVIASAMSCRGEGSPTKTRICIDDSDVTEHGMPQAMPTLHAETQYHMRRVDNLLHYLAMFLALLAATTAVLMCMLVSGNAPPTKSDTGTQTNAATDTTVACWKCGEKGHHRKVCPEYVKKSRSKTWRPPTVWIEGKHSPCSRIINNEECGGQHLRVHCDGLSDQQREASSFTSINPALAKKGPHAPLDLRRWRRLPEGPLPTCVLASAVTALVLLDAETARRHLL